MELNPVPPSPMMSSRNGQMFSPWKGLWFGKNSWRSISFVNCKITWNTSIHWNMMTWLPYNYGPWVQSRTDPLYLDRNILKSGSKWFCLPGVVKNIFSTFSQDWIQLGVNSSLKIRVFFLEIRQETESSLIKPILIMASLRCTLHFV